MTILENTDSVKRVFIDAINGRMAAVMSSNVDVNIIDEHGRTLLCCAAFSGNLDLVRHLVAKQISVTDGSLRVAASKYFTEIVRFLHEHGACIESFNTCAETGLFSALINIETYPTKPVDNKASTDENSTKRKVEDMDWYKQAECVVYLMRAGADLHLKTAHKSTAMKSLKSKGALNNIFEYLINSKSDLTECFIDGKSILTMAILFDDDTLIKKLADAGVDINPDQDESPLMLAVIEKNDSAVLALLNAGAELLKQNKKGLNALALSKKASITNLLTSRMNDQEMNLFAII